MKKVLILAEGQTEETFIKHILAPHLLPLNVSPVPIIIATKRIKSGSHFRGGVPSYEKVKKEILRLLRDSSAALVTLMIDYYGLPKSFPGRAAVEGATPLERVRFVEDALQADINHPRFVPYYSLHEFEALLFASTSVIAQVFARPDLEQRLAAIRAAFPTPEDIDDDPITAPSARLESLYPQYSKPFFGSRIAARIGIQAMREECKHFDDWLRQLEVLGSV